MVRRSALIALIAVLMVVGTGTAQADQRGPKLDRSLRAALASGRPGPQTVIIQMRPGVRSALRKALLAHGDTVKAEHPSINALTANVHGEDLAALANDPAVLSVSADALVSAHGDSNYNRNNNSHNNNRNDSGPSERALMYYSALRSTLGLTGLAASGRGIGIAVLDSGLAPATDFGDRITAFYDFTTGGPVAKNAYDDFGHGTHVAGLIAGSGARSSYNCYMGVAPDARLIGLKVLDGKGRGRTSDVISAIDFAVANRARFGIDVINLSLGHPILEPAATDPLVMAVERAVASGIVVVASAGNYGRNPETDEAGYAGVTSPGNAPSAVTVGAVKTLGTVERADDEVPTYSSRGPSWYDGNAKPDIVAPGDKMISVASSQGLLYDDNPLLRVRGNKRNDYSYFKMSGTSMSAAVASGVVALVLEQSRSSNSGERTITPNAVKGILQYSSIPVTDGSDALTQGAGSLNAGGALALASALDTSALYADPGTPVIDSTVTPSTNIGGQLTEWSRNIVWGTRLVAGSDSLWESNLVWGENIVWGTRLDDENIVWGTLGENVVWGTAADWLENVVWGTSLLTTVDGLAVVWSNALDVENIVWGTLADLDIHDLEALNVVWGTLSAGENIVWGTLREGENIVWGTRSSGGGR